MNVWANCDNCIYDNGDGSYCSDCLATMPPSNWKPSRRYRPPTNAQHIRSMTDEELAELLLDGGVYDKVCPNGCDGCDSDCEGHFLNWLKQPYKEEV